MITWTIEQSIANANARDAEKSACAEAGREYGIVLKHADLSPDLAYSRILNVIDRDYPDDNDLQDIFTDQAIVAGGFNT